LLDSLLQENNLKILKVLQLLTPPEKCLEEA